MSRLSDSQSRGLAHHRAAQGSPTLVFVAETIACVVSTLKRGTVLEVGGMMAEVALTLIVRQSDIVGTVPTAGKTVTHGGATYRVLAVGKTAGGSSYEFDLGNPNR
tara:strand:+ start:802 stop:1119 length:318 start_codon:yes stop_codon:yes gene_type:complete